MQAKRKYIEPAQEGDRFSMRYFNRGEVIEEGAVPLTPQGKGHE